MSTVIILINTVGESRVLIGSKLMTVYVPEPQLIVTGRSGLAASSAAMVIKATAKAVNEANLPILITLPEAIT